MCHGRQYDRSCGRRCSAFRCDQRPRRTHFFACFSAAQTLRRRSTWYAHEAYAPLPAHSIGSVKLRSFGSWGSRTDAACSIGSVNSRQWTMTSSSRFSLSRRLLQAKWTRYDGRTDRARLSRALGHSITLSILLSVPSQINEVPLHLLCRNSAVEPQLLRTLVSAYPNALYARADVRTRFYPLANVRMTSQSSLCSLDSLVIRYND